MKSIFASKARPELLSDAVCQSNHPTYLHSTSLSPFILFGATAFSFFDVMPISFFFFLNLCSVHTSHQSRIVSVNLTSIPNQFPGLNLIPCIIVHIFIGDKKFLWFRDTKIKPSSQLKHFIVRSLLRYFFSRALVFKPEKKLGPHF